ncbi:MAG: hypothetical protein ACRDQ5_15500, partial [Sciscionella sp.]
NKGDAVGVAPRPGRCALRTALTGLISTVLIILLALPARAEGADGNASGAGVPPPPRPTTGHSSLDLVIGGFATLMMVGFAGAVLWYVARNRGINN